MNRHEIIATMGATLKAGSFDPNTGESYTTGEAIHEATALLTTAERAEHNSDPGRLSLSFHGRHGATFHAEAVSATEATGGTPYDVIKIGWDLTLFLDRTGTTALRNTLTALIEEASHE